MYALINLTFYALLILIFSVWDELDKILDFSEILKTRDSHKIRDHKNFMKFGKFLVFTKIPKIPNFPGSSKIFSFHENRGSTFLKFPGIMVVTTCKKCNNMRVSWILRDQIQVFPRKMSTTISSFRRNMGPHLFWNSREL